MCRNKFSKKVSSVLKKVILKVILGHEVMS